MYRKRIDTKEYKIALDLEQEMTKMFLRNRFDVTRSMFNEASNEN